MARIYIDTNVFLDFYQSSTDRLAVFHELVKRASKVILPEQTLREFRRNRNARLSKLAKDVEANREGALFTTAVVQELPAFKEWVKFRDEAKRHAKDVAAQLRQWLLDESTDLVLKEFEKLVLGALHLPSTNDALLRAQKRKVLGEPPTSPDKHTVGDELIWETLLEGCKEDLIVVSRDGTFLENTAILKAEFLKHTGKRLVLVTSQLRAALDLVGESSEEVAKAEKAIEAKHVAGNPLETGICPKCGSQMEEDGYEGSDGDSAWWLFCPKCKHQEFPSR
jgi:predicted nucleic acid-binding protein